MASTEAMLRKAKESIDLYNAPVDLEALERAGLIVRKSKTKFLLVGKKDQLPGEFWEKVSAVAMTTGGAVVTIRLPRSQRQ